MKIVELWIKDIRPHMIMTPAAFRNALTFDMAIGGSSNTMLHLPAIANEAGVPFSFDEVERICDSVPHLVKLKPAEIIYRRSLRTQAA
jgi:dihydroxy-acid dehydratase